MGVLCTLMLPSISSTKPLQIASPNPLPPYLREVEASGVSEVILYFNYGMKPHDMVKDQMRRFMRDIAPAFSSEELRVRPEQLSPVST